MPTKKAPPVAGPWATPTFERLGDDYLSTVTFARVGVGLRLERVRDDSRGEIHGFVNVYTFDPATKKPQEHIHWSRLNIASRQTRAGLANELAEREPELLDWRKAIEFLCDRVYRAFTAGPERMRLNEATLEDRPRHLIKEVLPIDQPSTLYADGGAMKSYVALTIAVAVQLGTTVAGFEPLEQGQVAILDYDTIVQEVAERVCGICRGQSLPEDAALEMLYVPMRRPLAEQIEHVKRICDEFGVKLIVVDHIAAAVGKEMDGHEGVTAFFDALRQLVGVTSVVLSHRSKGDRDRKDDSPYGSVQVTARSRAVYAVRRSSDDSVNPVRVGLFNVKRNRGAKARPIGIEFTFAEDQHDPTVRLGIFDPREDAEFVVHGSIADQIRFYVRDGAKSVKELAELTSRTEAVIRATLHRMGDMTPADGRPRGSGNDSSRRWGLVAENGARRPSLNVVSPTGTEGKW